VPEYPAGFSSDTPPSAAITGAVGNVMFVF